MKKLSAYILILMACLLASCDVHEWPEPTVGTRLNLHLRYQTQLPKWIHPYNERAAQMDDNSVLTEGYMQYIVRLYPVLESGKTSLQPVGEWIFGQDIANGYNLDTYIDVEPGNYELMVWSNILFNQEAAPFYDPTSFAEIMLQLHQANTDYRDAFRGKEKVNVEATIGAQLPQDIEVAMQRPLAKFEFVSTDLQTFVQREINRAALENRAKPVTYDDIMRGLGDYNVTFHYVGYMPDAFSIFTDKPVDSSTGNKFASRLTKISDTEASMGFDYVFTNGKETAVTMQIEVTDAKGTQLSLTKPIEVPLKRSYHTIMKGAFLTATASGGISINPEFEGDHNVMLRDEEADEENPDYEIDID